MAHELEPIFRELGLSQYLDTFVDQGFDCWDTILDIQESDLDALGVKLGHRRKLQRRIANARGIAPSISLGPSAKPAAEDAKQEAPRSEPSRPENGLANHGSHQEGSGVVKRKYRRHPKSDENAPERPPSAYVLFSNKMREDLKSQHLTFTEIAKLVGENWQNLPAAEKEVFESQANAAKEKYHRDLIEYKKTPEYRRYALYLHEFKERQARQNQDGTKRARLEPARLRHGSTSSSATPGGSTTTGNGSGSGSERPQGSEPSPTRKQRGNSTASLTESQHSSTAPTPLPQRNSLDELVPSPRTAHFDTTAHDLHHDSARRVTPWTETGRRSLDTGSRHLPSLSDVLDDNSMAAPSSAAMESRPYAGFVAANHRRPLVDGSPRLIPPLPHESSSSGSGSSSASSGTFSRTGDATLPLHALLSRNSSVSSIPSAYERKSMSSSRPTPDSPIMPTKPPYAHSNGLRGYGFQSAGSAFQDMKVELSEDGDVVMTSDDNAHGDRSGNSKGRFDGMSALLKAGEIVSRHNGA